LAGLPFGTVEPGEARTACQLPGKRLLASRQVKRLKQGLFRMAILIRKQRSLYVALDPQQVGHIKKVSAFLDPSNLPMGQRLRIWATMHDTSSTEPAAASMLAGRNLATNRCRPQKMRSGK
jgi:hypothetical protein